MSNIYPFNITYNSSAFDGRVESDFIKFANIENKRKSDLIDYTAQDFYSLKETLLNYIRAVLPLDYSNFVESDSGVEFAELVAYIGAIIHNKIDLVANNLYIDTALNSNSLRRLLNLLGIDMKGPTGAKASGLVSLNSALVSGESVTIPKTDREIVISGRDGNPINFTLYKVRTNGGIDLQGDSISLDFSESTNGLTFSSLVLLEGVLKSQSGSFSTTQSIQTFDITDRSILEGSIVVSGVDGIFEETKNIYLASGTDDLVFQKIYKDDNSATLVFGDGVNAKSPTVGSDYVVYYRTGGGTRGNVVKNAINKSVTLTITGGGGGTVGATITNPTAAAGGFEAETADHAKRYYPGVFAAQYRAVTGEDYAALANAFVGTAGTTAKALPVLRSNSAAANIIDIYVLSKATDTQLQRASFAFKNELYSYLDGYRMLTDEIVILDGVVRTIDLVCTIFIDKNRERFEEELKRKVATSIQQFFNVDNRDFGQKLDLGELLSWVIKVPEVRFFKVDNLDSDIFVNFNEIIQLNNLEINVEYV